MNDRGKVWMLTAFAIVVLVLVLVLLALAIFDPVSFTGNSR